MKEFKLEDNVSSANSNGKSLPAKPSVWDKVKSVLFKEIDVKGILFKEIDLKGFLLQEIDLNKPITVTMSPKTEKVFGEVHDFLFQEVKFPELHDFLFQDITFFGSKKNKEQA